MSRCGYSDAIDDWELARWRGAVAQAIKGRRGQDFLKELLAALDAMPYKGLISDELQNDIGVCAIGCVGVRRGIDMSNLDPDDYETIARVFGISRALAQEIEFMNDEWANTPQQRFQFVRKWVVEQIRKDQP